MEAAPAAGAPGAEPAVSKAQQKKAAKEAEKARKKAEKAQEREAAGKALTVHPLASVEPTVSLAPPSGTRDFYPDEMRAHQWLFAHFREVARQFAFQEYDAPVLEHDELYKRKAGEEITAQMFNFVDKVRAWGLAASPRRCPPAPPSRARASGGSRRSAPARGCAVSGVRVPQDGYNVTLRPEMTPSLARMVLAMGPNCILPLKWCSLPQVRASPSQRAAPARSAPSRRADGRARPLAARRARPLRARAQCWRFEAIQRGRKREHYQWNMDIIGEPSISAELELLAAICAFFERIGITSADVGLKVNSRTVLASVLKLHGVPEAAFAPVCVIVDKLDKIGADAVVAELEAKEGVPADAGRAIVATLSIKSFDELKALLGSAADAAVDELGRLFELAEDYGISEWLTFDASVVRGLAYYTGIVFEVRRRRRAAPRAAAAACAAPRPRDARERRAPPRMRAQGFDRSGELRAICGGGRYNRLLTLYGAPNEVSAVGFGFGDCVVMELLALKGLTPALPQRTDFVVVPYDAGMRGPALRVARELRRGGYSCDMLLEPTKKVKNAFSYADRIGGERVVFVAPDEWQRGCVRVKDLRSGDEVRPRAARGSRATAAPEGRVVRACAVRLVRARARAGRNEASRHQVRGACGQVGSDERRVVINVCLATSSVRPSGRPVNIYWPQYSRQLGRPPAGRLRPRGLRLRGCGASARIRGGRAPPPAASQASVGLMG